MKLLFVVCFALVLSACSSNPGRPSSSERGNLAIASVGDAKRGVLAPTSETPTRPAPSPGSQRPVTDNLHPGYEGHKPGHDVDKPRPNRRKPRRNRDLSPGQRLATEFGVGLIRFFFHALIHDSDESDHEATVAATHTDVDTHVDTHIESIEESEVLDDEFNWALDPWRRDL